MSTLEDAMNLLVTWGLSHLCEKFREEEVCTLAFQHLTETDLKALIPKIGPRSIFRAHLTQWRQMQNKNVTEPKPEYNYGKNTYPTSDGINDDNSDSKRSLNTSADSNFLQPEVKYELVAENDISPIDYVQLLSGNSDTESLDNTILDEYEKPQLMEQNKNISYYSEEAKASKGARQTNKDTLNVQELLNQNAEGQSVVEFYQTYKKLDFNHRRIIVKTIVSKVIENRVTMSIDCFHNLTKQIIELFPTENPGTYYMPRTGNTCPKGALYNKYLNMGKRLRRTGQLQYRIHRSNNMNSN